ncbi:MAG: tetratricopeptide repeat protein [Hyphomonadaceae bacterium]
MFNQPPPSLETGRLAARSGRWDTARKAFEASADRGEADGYYELALLYWYGNGAPKSLEKAVALFKLAAEGGNADGQHALGLALLPTDRAGAERWLLRAAEAGHPPAMTRLAELVMDREPDSARALLARAAESGYPAAMIAYGQALANPDAAGADPSEGLAWLYAAVAITGDADIEHDAKALARVLHARSIESAQKRGRQLARKFRQAG